MTALFWTSLFLILYTYALYPALMALLARLHPRPWRQAPWPANQPQPPIAILMAVRNGATLLSARIAQLTALDPHLVHEIILVSDGSTDATPQILQAAAANRVPQVRQVSSSTLGLLPPTPIPHIHPIILPDHSGKSSALNAAIAVATAEILVFIDVRPEPAPGALAALLSNFADPTVGCVAGELLLRTEGQHATASAVSGLYWRYEQAIRNHEAAFDSPVGVYGGFYAIRRALATPFPPGLILDDMFQPLAVISQGYRSVIDRTALVTDTWPAKVSNEFDRKVRTLAGNFQLIAAAPWLLTPRNRVLFQLVSHKLLRLLVPYCFAALLLASAVLGLHSAAFALFGLAQAVFWFLAALSVRFKLPLIHRLAAPAGALLVLNLAAVAALHRFLFTRGPLWKTWTPTATHFQPS